jgi:hypothetical protein
MCALDKGQAYSLSIVSSERMLHKDYDRKGSVAKKKSKENKTLVMSLKRLGAKTN